MPGSKYQIILLGDLRRSAPIVTSAVSARADDLGLGKDVFSYLTAKDFATRDNRLPSVALFFGGDAGSEDDVITTLIADSTVIIPLISDIKKVSSQIPKVLQHINALKFDDAVDSPDRIVSLIFETFKLLRKERKLFISYKRDDAQPLADRLYDELDKRGFDVFLDVRSVPPAKDFQESLWHRMSDSDVIILIDTPGFRKSRWTTAELAQANATNIQILHLLWPGQNEDGASSFSYFFKLKDENFEGGIPGKGEELLPDSAVSICDMAERLRARALAARHRYLIDNFCDTARDQGFHPAVQPERWISLKKSGGRLLAIIPAVGIPTSDRINEIFHSMSALPTKPDDLWIIYDNRGVMASWLEHLNWLDQHLPIRSVQMSHVGAALKGVAR